MKKLLSVLLALMLMMSCLAGCTASKSKTYYCTTSGHTSSYIRLDKGDTETSGTGYASNVYWTELFWDLTGNFKYTASKVTMTSGLYKNQVFTSGISINFTATTITFADKKYTC